MDYPVRTEFKESRCVPVDDDMREKYGLHKRTQKAAQCVHCMNWFPKSKVEVDHIIGESSLKTVDDIITYLDHLMCDPENMQLSCKPCHKIKTYAERYDMTFEQARLEKAVIQWLKDHNTSEQKELLIAAGFPDEEINNAGNRRIAARKLLTP